VHMFVVNCITIMWRLTFNVLLKKREHMKICMAFDMLGKLMLGF
jgi:hypothetical protein